MPRLSFFAPLVALSLLILAAPPPSFPAIPAAAERQTPPAASKKRLTLDDVDDPALFALWSGGNAPGPVFLRWLPDGAHYLEARAAEPGGAGTRTARRLFFVDARTGRSEPAFDPERVERAFAALPGVSATDARAVAARAAGGGYPLSDDAAHVLVTHANDLWAYHRGVDRAIRVTNTPNESEEFAAFSPDARRVAFVKNNNLFVASADAGASEERALTNDGRPNVIYNGCLDWVYDEEIYGRGTGRAFWWSPDGARIAFLRLDETPVRAFAVVNDLAPRGGEETETTPYPLPGDPNPLARLGVVRVSGSNPSPPVWMDMSAYAPADLLLVRAGWTPDAAQVVFQAQNREQTFLDLCFADPATGRAHRVLRETTPAWVEADAEPRFLRDGTFLWQSERTGFKHLYHYRPDGTLIAVLTKGNWEVRALDAVDESNGFIYLTGTRNSPIAEHVYRVALDGRSEPTPLTQARAGNHRADFSPTGTFFRDSWSSLAAPPQSALFAADGALVRAFTPARAAGLTDYALGTPEKMQVRTRNGFVMDALLLKPPDFDPAKKYPVFCRVYAGPHAPQVADRWGTFGLWDHYLAQQGYLVWLCDNRSASGQGAQSAWTSYRNFGAQELRDIEDGLTYLKGQPWVDSARIGIYGWSFGGYMSAYALTHSTFFKIGIAGAPVTDWALYDSVYTERYLGTPQSNPDGYKKSAVVGAAANLSGRLLLLHGTLDDNVHVQNTLQLAYALQKAGKPFEMMLYPASRHGIGDPQLRKHLTRLRTRFILENL